MSNETDELDGRLQMSLFKALGHRLSTTAHLVLVPRYQSKPVCKAYIGIGHLHRGDGPRLRQELRAKSKRAANSIGRHRSSRSEKLLKVHKQDDQEIALAQRLPQNATGLVGIHVINMGRELSEVSHFADLPKRDRISRSRSDVDDLNTRVIHSFQQVPAAHRLMTSAARQLSSAENGTARRKIGSAATGRRREKEERHTARGFRLQFGFRYTHFFYSMQPTPPFRLLATSGEFCLAAQQDDQDCESVQFVSGLAYLDSRDSKRLLVTYGVNDCEAKIGGIDMGRVWSMLRPLNPATGVCG